MTDGEVRLPTIDRLEPYEMTIEPMSVAGHAYARDGVVPPPVIDGDEVPWTFFTLLRSQFRLGASLHDLMERNPRRGLMVGIAYVGQSPGRAGDRVSATPTLDSQRTVERGDGALVLTAVKTTWTSPTSRALDPSTGWLLHETTTMADVFGSTTPPTPTEPSIEGEFVELGEVSRLRIAWCCVATEDLQEVHHDPRMARDRGYDDVLVPGTLLASIAEDHLRSALGSLSSFRIRFTAPVYPDDGLQFRMQSDGPERHFEFTTTRDDRPTVVATGEGASS